MNPRHFAIVAASLAAVALGTGACTQPAEPQAAAPADTVTHTIVEAQPAPTPPVVIEYRDGQPVTQDSTTVRADKNGISIETKR
ncbi:hypothetical protein [uncultured Brevundimonas sp.]|uniref:hypothetical protein n=1 Tax=uncultured Brevundimonas sp. TaxID=213418 RepID=UPI0030EE2306|tara:strand:- start:165 stop:416 length:252 start_codon:yes stop_codon:yes gene_type:complete